MIGEDMAHRLARCEENQSVRQICRHWHVQFSRLFAQCLKDLGVSLMRAFMKDCFQAIRALDPGVQT